MAAVLSENLPLVSDKQLQLVGEKVHSDVAGLAEYLAVRMDPQRNAAPDRDALSAIGKKTFELQVVSVIRCREDPEEIQRDGGWTKGGIRSDYDEEV